DLGIDPVLRFYRHVDLIVMVERPIADEPFPPEEYGLDVRAAAAVEPMAAAELRERPAGRVVAVEADPGGGGEDRAGTVRGQVGIGDLPEAVDGADPAGVEGAGDGAGPVRAGFLDAGLQRGAHACAHEQVRG